MSEIYATLGATIRTLRQDRGMKQQELAEKLGMLRSSLTQIECGNRRLQIHELLQIAEVFEVPVQRLLFSEDRKEQRIRRLSKQIEDILIQASEPLQELFEDVYGGQLNDDYARILGELVLISQTYLPVAEMKYKKVGEQNDH